MSRTKKAPAKRTKKAPATRQPRKPKQLNYVIVRAEHNALFAGEEVYTSASTRSIVLRNSRRIWASSARYDAICKFGIPEGDTCNVGPTIPGDVAVFGVLEILLASVACRDNLTSLPE